MVLHIFNFLSFELVYPQLLRKHLIVLEVSQFSIKHLIFFLTGPKSGLYSEL